MKGDANVASAREKDAMKILTTSAIALSVLGFASGAQAQQAKLSFEGDMVRGAQAGAPGPFCVLNNQFKHLEKVVFRFRMLDAAGKPLDKDGLKSLVVELPDGQKLAAQFGQHPAARRRAGSLLDRDLDDSGELSQRARSSTRRLRRRAMARPRPGSRSRPGPRSCRWSKARLRSSRRHRPRRSSKLA